MADTDPLEYRQRKHADLDVTTHGLSLWDLDQSFATGGFGGRLKPARILGILRDSYCRTVGIEYMHIQDPDQRAWIQAKVEVRARVVRDEQVLGSAQAQRRRGVRDVPADQVRRAEAVLAGGRRVGHRPARPDHVPRRGRPDGRDLHRDAAPRPPQRAGQHRRQVLRPDLPRVRGPAGPQVGPGSGDVKYHLGTEGEFTSEEGSTTKVYLAANPSHLEAVDPVLEGIVRAKQDRLDLAGEAYTVLPLLLHGDAAFAGQGVVAETLHLSQLRGYRTGGTVHVVINNQVGFTTSPSASRSSVYSTDVARMIQAPIFHVNGDDPEACVRVAELAYEFRQAFNKDVVIDMVCYRRRGHNEGDDPSMTQPLMYNLIEAKRSVRKLYTEALIGRGDISQGGRRGGAARLPAAARAVFVETKEAIKARPTAARSSADNGSRGLEKRPHRPPTTPPHRGGRTTPPSRPRC